MSCPIIERPGIPIIALTANAMKEEKERCRKVGMDDFLSKPVSRRKLKDMLLKWSSSKAA